MGVAAAGAGLSDCWTVSGAHPLHHAIGEPDRVRRHKLRDLLVESRHSANGLHLSRLVDCMAGAAVLDL